MSRRNKSKTTNKGNIVCFRINDDHSASLSRQLMSAPVVGLRTSNQLARKLVVDYLEGRLSYNNVNDRYVDPDVAARLSAA